MPIHNNTEKSLYFELKSGSYFTPVGGRYLQLDKTEAKLHLRHSGLSADAWVGNLNELEVAFFNAQCERAVSYAGPLSGHSCGLLKLPNGGQILITDSPSIVQSKRGIWDTLKKFFGELLGDQEDIFFAWLKFARESLLSGDMRPGQLLALAGESGCGKSLCQLLITELLGRRMAKPYGYMTKQTPFNGELVAAEHWCIEDESASTDIRARREFGAALKQACVNRDMYCNPKGKQAFTATTFRRVTLSVNDEEENLCILPPMDNSISDKVILLRCARAEVGSNRKAVWKKLTDEIPALCYWIEKMDVPREMRSVRYGVRDWQNEELMAMLTSVSHEARLLALIDSVMFGDGSPVPETKMPAESIENRLLNSTFRWQVEKLLSWPSACGVFLSRLESKQPERVSSTRIAGQRLWTIKAKG